MKRRIGILTSGGDCQGLNAAIRGVGKALLNRIDDIEIFGMQDGYRGLIDRDYKFMESRDFSGIITHGGTILGTSRQNYIPGKDIVDDNGESLIPAMMDTYNRLNLDCLVIMGGNGTQKSAKLLMDAGMNVVTLPKTIDNDIWGTDVTFGFQSAVDIATNVIDYIHSTASSHGRTFLVELMGRDAGWLAASSCLSGIVDLVILPEVAFEKEVFLAEVRRCLEEKNKCYVVVSEGCKYADGTYIAAGEAKGDGFGHAILGGAGVALKNMILESGTAERCKVQDLSTAQRCFATAQSLVDVTESFQLGMSAHMRSTDGKFTGKMVGVRRKDTEEYDVEYFAVDADKVANFVKSFPSEWILPNYRGITEEAYDYLRPLIVGSPVVIYNDGVPAYVKPYYMR